MRNWRKMTWVLWAWSILIIAWAVAGGSHASSTCTNAAYQNACNAGAGIGVLLILFIGFVGFCFFSIIWFMTRPRVAV